VDITRICDSRTQQPCDAARRFRSVPAGVTGIDGIPRIAGGAARDSFMTHSDRLERFDSVNSVRCMVRLRRPTISAKVIKDLLSLGYLQPAKRHKPHVVERALARLRTDLIREGVVSSSNPAERALIASDDAQPLATSRPIPSS
jgi:hypothetical protein